MFSINGACSVMYYNYLMHLVSLLLFRLYTNCFYTVSGPFSYIYDYAKWLISFVFIQVAQVGKLLKYLSSQSTATSDKTDQADMKVLCQTSGLTQYYNLLSGPKVSWNTLSRCHMLNRAIDSDKCKRLALFMSYIRSYTLLYLPVVRVYHLLT